MTETKSDIKGVVFCTLCAVVALGAGAGFVAGLMQVINHEPRANVAQTVKAGMFCLFITSGVVAYVRNRMKGNGDKSNGEGDTPDT